MQNYPGMDYVSLGIWGWVVLIFLVLVWYLWPRKEELSDEDKDLIEWYNLQIKQYRQSLSERDYNDGHGRP
jgi:hypothetical protein